ncbi:MAG: M23 family metallopeptidase [Desulfosporosinus sp.]|nr:M23 family metallopeptidase [Desulfosporosinus sp.]
MPSESVPVDFKMKGKFLPPISGPVMAGFGDVGSDDSVHQGIDVGSALGIPVVTPASGVVTIVGEDPQLGKMVKIDFGDGWTTVLGNLGEIKVEKGQRIEKGQVVGTVGLSAPLKKPWLHFELRKIINRLIQSLISYLLNRRIRGIKKE